MKKIFTLLFLLIISISSKAQWVTIPDANFAAKLQQLYPSCMNGNQMDTTCSGIVNATNLAANSSNISSLEGLQYFDSLSVLWCLNNQLTSLPSLPNIIELYCNNNLLTSLPSLPNIIELYCNNNLLTNLPSLPSSLTKLECSYNQLTSLSSLPNSLTTLYCYNNQLTSLPSLPNSLTQLRCYYNQLTSLPSLPNSLTTLNCGDNQLTSLPSLPNSLTYLYCYNNQLTSLPSFPISFTYLNCSLNQLTSLPSLPPIMNTFIINNNPNLICLPPIQEISSALSTYFNISNTGISCLPNIIQHPNIASLPAIDTMPICDLFNESGCEVGYNISGSIYKDIDELCSSTSDIVPLYSIQVQLTDATDNLLQQVYTNANGQYSFDTDLGIYKVKFDTILNPFVPICPASNSITSTLTALDSMDTNFDFNVRCKYLEDLLITSTVQDSGIFRPARKALVKINAGDFASFFGASCFNGSGTLKVFYTGATAYNGVANGSLSPDLIIGDTLIWNIADFAALSANVFHIRFLTDSFPVIGSQVCVTAMISSSNTESNLSNNMLTHCFSIVNSYDPNIKEVYPTQVQQAGETLTYTIHFQNTGTAEAEHVKVLDTLDANLDWNTFQLLGASHENITQVYNTTGIVKFNFPNINLADSFSNEPESHGWIQYKIKMKDNLVPPIEIHNTASIYFDFNSPIVTNDALVDFNPLSVININTKNSSIKIQPNPGNNLVTITSTSSSFQLRVIDMQGRIVFNKMGNNYTSTIDISKWAAGIYFIEAQGENQIQRGKLLKQ
jgi:uncharacterized repeat protein (TIGR01451 family)